MSDGPCIINGHTHTKKADEEIGALACTHTYPLAEDFPMKRDAPGGSMKNTRREMSGAHATEANVAHGVGVTDPDDEQPFFDHQHDVQHKSCERSDGSNLQACAHT
eukprot:6524017-Karenia_brevis.AAC.1